LAVVGLCLVEQGTSTFYFPKEGSERAVERIVANIDPRAEAFFYVGIGQVPPWFSNVEALLAAQRSGVPTINFYSGRSPKGYPLHRKIAPNPEMLRRVRQDLDQWIQAQGLDRDRVQLIEEGEIRAWRTGGSQGSDP
jgi:hypothetical protein